MALDAATPRNEAVARASKRMIGTSGNGWRYDTPRAARVARSVVPADALELRPLRLGRQQLGANLVFDFLGEFGTGPEEFPGVVLALANTLAVVAVPGSRLLDDALGRTHVDDLALTRNTEPVHDLEFGLAERRRDLVLHHLHA